MTSFTKDQKAENAHASPLFPLGRLFVTNEAQVRISPTDIASAIQRHAAGDWGDVDAQDRQENEFSLTRRLRLLSSYRSTEGARFWVITEADRLMTTVLLPSDY